MRAVFVDTFYFIALLNPSDAHHATAVEASGSIAARLVTTQWVLIEVADALSAPAYRSSVAEFLGDLAEDKGITIVAHEPHWYDRGLQLYARRPDKSWSLTDCMSFVVMTELGLGEALTGDHHFEQAGFRALLRTR